MIISLDNPLALHIRRGDFLINSARHHNLSLDYYSEALEKFESDKQVISGSPITRDITGEEFYSTIYSVRESPLKKGIIWVGANDGPVHITTDAGKRWKNVTPNKNIKGGRVDSSNISFVTRIFNYFHHF